MNYKEKKEKIKILLQKKESLLSTIKNNETEIKSIKSEIKSIKLEFKEIEEQWKDLQNKYDAAREISEQQGLMKLNNKRSLSNEEIHSIMSKYDYDDETHNHIISASSKKSKVSILQDKVFKLKNTIAQIQPLIDDKKSEIPKIQKEINNFQETNLF